MRKRYLECGKIVSAHGIAGEFKVQPWVDSPGELEGVSALYLDEQGEQPLRILRARVHKGMLLFSAEGIGTVDEAVRLRGRVLYLDRNDLPLSPGEFFIQDLLGACVADADSGEEYGTLCDVSKTGANDVYHVLFPDGKERLVPVIPQVVVETDPEAGLIKIRPLKGLFDDED